MRGEHLERRYAAIGGEHRVPGKLKGVANGLAQVGVVFDDQDR